VQLTLLNNLSNFYEFNLKCPSIAIYSHKVERTNGDAISGGDCIYSHKLGRTNGDAISGGDCI
jgi:hypothetical protein